MSFKRIGHIANFYGLKGGLKVINTSSYPEERYKKNKKVELRDARNNLVVKATISRVEFVSFNTIKLFLKEFDDINQIEQYINLDIYTDCPRVGDNLFYDEIIDSDVIDAKGKTIDKVSSITDGPICEYLNLASGKIIPLQEGIFIKNIDAEAKKVFLTELGSETYES